MARRVAVVGSPHLASVLHVGPGVVYAAPPPGLPRGASSTAEAAELALQACEAAAALHVAGVGSLCFDRHNLRVVGPAEGRRIFWLVPGAPDLGWLLDTLLRPRAARVDVAWIDEPARRAAWGIVDFFAALLPQGTLDRPTNPALQALAAVRLAPSDLPADVAGVARLLLPLLPASPALLERVAAIPRVAVLPRILLDWDAIIPESEAKLAVVGPANTRFLALPLAAAYHQRASRRWASGDLASALADAEHAAVLDGASLTIATTRAVLLDALGRRAEARQVVDEGLRARLAPRAAVLFDDSPPPSELPRAHGTRGMFALRDGAPAEAEVDLRRALDGALPAREAALFAHALGAARYALDDFDGAVEAENAVNRARAR